MLYKLIGGAIVSKQQKEGTYAMMYDDAAVSYQKYGFAI